MKWDQKSKRRRNALLVLAVVSVGLGIGAYLNADAVQNRSYAEDEEEIGQGNMWQTANTELADLVELPTYSELSPEVLSDLSERIWKPEKLSDQLLVPAKVYKDFLSQDGADTTIYENLELISEAVEHRNNAEQATEHAREQEELAAASNAAALGVAGAYGVINFLGKPARKRPAKMKAPGSSH